MQRLKDLFASLPKDSSVAGEFQAERIPSRPEDYIAVGAEGQPIWLLSFSGSEIYKPPIRLRHLSVDFGSKCRIRNSAGTSENAFIVIACGADDNQLQDFFLSTVESLLLDLPLHPSLSDAQRRLKSLIELFRKLELPSHRTLKGLWAELFTIYKSPNIASWLAAWRVGSNDKFDFSWKGSNLDVKATEAPLRVHEFSLGQVECSPDKTIIVSILLRRSASGLNVLELATLIASEVAKNRNDLLEKLWKNVGETLGADFALNLDIRFDPHFSTSTLRVIEASQIARPIVSDTHVFDVHFKVDVSELAQHSVLTLFDCAVAS